MYDTKILGPRRFVMASKTRTVDFCFVQSVLMAVCLYGRRWGAASRVSTAFPTPARELEVEVGTETSVSLELPAVLQRQRRTDRAGL